MQQALNSKTTKTKILFFFFIFSISKINNSSFRNLLIMGEILNLDRVEVNIARNLLVYLLSDELKNLEREEQNAIATVIKFLDKVVLTSKTL